MSQPNDPGNTIANMPVVAPKFKKKAGSNPDVGDIDDLMTDATQIVSNQTITQTQAKVVTTEIDALVETIVGINKALKYDATAHKITMGEEEIFSYTFIPPTPTAPVKAGMHMTTPPTQQVQAACTIKKPEVLGTNFIQELLEKMGPCEANCATVDAAVKFIALAGKHADKLTFPDKPPFNTNAAKKEIQEATQKALAAAPQVTLKPTSF